MAGTSEPTGFLSVATLLKAHGVRGEFKLQCSVDNLELVRELAEQGESLVMRTQAGEERDVLVEEVRGHHSAPIVAIRGVDDKLAADALRGATLHVDRSLLAQVDELEDDEHYLADLRGCAAHATHDGGAIGVVEEAALYPGGNVVLTIRLDAGGTLLAPLAGDAVTAVDTDARRIDFDTVFLGIDEPA